MSAENVIFRKIKEISARGTQLRPTVDTSQIAEELSVESDTLLLSLDHLKQLRLISYCDSEAMSIKLTLLGSVVNRDK